MTRRGAQGQLVPDLAQDRFDCLAPGKVLFEKLARVFQGDLDVAAPLAALRADDFHFPLAPLAEKLFQRLLALGQAARPAPRAAAARFRSKAPGTRSSGPRPGGRGRARGRGGCRPAGRCDRGTRRTRRSRPPGPARPRRNSTHRDDERSVLRAWPRSPPAGRAQRPPSRIRAPRRGAPSARAAAGDLARAPLEEQDRPSTSPGTPPFRPAGCRGRSSGDLMQQAGARAVAQDLVGARADRKDALELAQRVAHGRGRGVRPEVQRALFLLELAAALADDDRARPLVAEVDAHADVGLVVVAAGAGCSVAGAS